MINIFSKELLQDRLSILEAEKMQIKYSKISFKINSNINNLIHEDDIHIITAVDVSYYIKNGYEWGIACAVFWDKTKEQILKSSYSFRKINFPYKAGYLGFREAKVITNALKNAKLKPDLLICDGHGLIHPRSFGEAIHLGLALNIPSFGVAKNPYVGFYDSEDFSYIKGTKIPIWKNKNIENIEKNVQLGYRICLANGRKPVFVSIGYKTDIDTTIKVSLSLTFQHRQPEPLYLADRFAKNKIQEILK